MRKPQSAFLLGSIAVFSVLGLNATVAAPNASDQDKAFVAKVSQGGMYEVELGKVAESQGMAQDIKDQGNTEAHDHDLVGKALKSAADSAGIEFSTGLNAEFKDRLAKISGTSGQAFDKAYVEDMKKIHAADGAAFKKEAKDGSNPALKAFAASTFDIVQRHLGELGAKTAELK
jgi:putative membrane protein